MYRKPNWNREGREWPLREASQFVNAGRLKWHVQTIGKGPVLLLLHGTGAATHSWAKLIPLLATKYTIVSIDLPGHGFTATPSGQGLSLSGMALLIASLVDALKIEPFAIIGHSAGAAIGAELILSGKVKATHLIALNGAFRPFDGLAAHFFPVVAKLITLNPVTIFALASGGGDIARVTKLMDGTGSKLDAQSLELYARLFGTPGHVAGVMGMMARWELDKLAPRLPSLSVPLTLIVGSGDLTIPPSVSAEVARMVPNATLITLPNLGHLAHEEDPIAVAAAIETALAQAT
jgi:magnesium chelatase accessory protein